MTPEQLAQELDMPVERVREALDNLERRGLVRARHERTARVNAAAERGLRWLDWLTGRKG